VHACGGICARARGQRAAHPASVRAQQIVGRAVHQRPHPCLRPPKPPVPPAPRCQPPPPPSRCASLAGGPSCGRAPCRAPKEQPPSGVLPVKMLPRVPYGRDEEGGCKGSDATPRRLEHCCPWRPTAPCTGGWQRARAAGAAPSHVRFLVSARACSPSERRSSTAMGNWRWLGRSGTDAECVDWPSLRRPTSGGKPHWAKAGGAARLHGLEGALLVLSIRMSGSAERLQLRRLRAQTRGGEGGPASPAAWRPRTWRTALT